MRDGVTAHADDGVRGQQPARLLDGHVRLAEVDARGADGEGDIDAVVNEQRDIVLVADGLALPRDVDKLSQISEYLRLRLGQSNSPRLSRVPSL